MKKYDTLVFPGQGSQKPGMGLDFVENFEEAAKVYARASDALGLDFSELCRGNDGRIHLTEYTQPAILGAEIAILEVVKKQYSVAPLWFGGHSLGEYTALVAAGVIPFEVALRLVRLRGQLMQSAVPVGVGKMVAFIMDDLPVTEIQEFALSCQVDLANINSPSQVVISGQVQGVDQVVARFRPFEADGRMRIVPLEASAPFHSRWMQGIESGFRAELNRVKSLFQMEQATQVISNVTGCFHSNSREQLVDLLVRQISLPVRWRDNMKTLYDKSPRILEIGPERTLRTFFFKSGINITAINDLRFMKRAFADELADSEAKIA